MIKLLRTNLLAVLIFSNFLNVSCTERAALKNLGAGSLVGLVTTFGAYDEDIPFLPTLSKIAMYLYIATKGGTLLGNIFVEENNGIINNSSALIGLMVGSGIALAIHNMDENYEQTSPTHVLISKEALEELLRAARKINDTTKPAPDNDGTSEPEPDQEKEVAALELK